MSAGAEHGYRFERAMAMAAGLAREQAERFEMSGPAILGEAFHGLARRILDLSAHQPEGFRRRVEREMPVPWRCFHCDETFYTREAAAQHFGEGNYEHEEPVCIEAATTELKTLVITNREMWERLREVEGELEQAEFVRDQAEYKLKQPKYARFEEIEGRMQAAEVALAAGPKWLARLLRWKAERDWQRARRAMERLTAEAEALS